MGEIVALAFKDLRVILRDKAGLFFLFFFPLLIAIFFGFIFSGVGSAPEERKIRIALVDQDATEGSQAFAKALKESAELDVILEKPGGAEGAEPEPLTRDDAEGMVRKGKVAAYIALPEGFGQARENMFWEEPPVLEMSIDPSRKAETAMLQGLLLKQVFEGMQDQFGDRDKMLKRLDDGIAALDMPGATEFAKDWVKSLRKLNEALAEMPELDEEGEEGGYWGFSEPLRIEARDVQFEWEGPRNPFQITFPQGIIWGMLGTAATFAISMVVERVRGTLVRLRMAPISRAHILAGKGLACFIAMLIVVVTLMVIGRLAFKVRPHSFPLLILAAACSSICFVGLMMFVSTLGKTEQAAGAFGWGFMLILAVTGGASMPLFFMPPWLQTVSRFSPVRWAVYSLEGAIWRGLTFGEMAVPSLILLGSGIAFFALGVAMFSWTE